MVIMFSHPIALENSICERKPPINGCNRAELTNLHGNLNSDLAVIFSEFIQLPTSYEIHTVNDKEIHLENFDSQNSNSCNGFFFF